jgi:hypothetical protein
MSVQRYFHFLSNHKHSRVDRFSDSTTSLYFQLDDISIAFQLLSQVRSTDIEKVEIGISEYVFTSNLMDLGPPEIWSRLDAILSTPRFSKLREVMIAMPSKPSCSFRKRKNLLPMSIDNTRIILCVPSREWRTHSMCVYCTIAVCCLCALAASSSSEYLG